MQADPILIACFDFPPNQGIGGRRWAKFAKQLAILGHEVHVIKADPVKRNKISPWTDDVDHLNIHVYSLSREYPEVISHFHGGLRQKIQYRISRARLMRQAKGTIYDVALGFERTFLNKAREVIETHGIQRIIGTGAPFNLAYYTCKLKSIFPQAKILIDYRDPWITAQNYGMPALNERRMAHEKQKQDFVFQHADIVTAPNPFMLNEIRTSSDNLEQAKCQFEVIPHSYDSDDINRFLDPSKKSNRWVYGGAIYMGMTPILNELNDWLNKLRKEAPEAYDNLHIDIYSPDHQSLDNLCENHNALNAYPPIGKDYFYYLNEARVSVLFLADHNKDFQGTKFFEMLPYRHPIAYFGPAGVVSSFIEENRLGRHINSYSTLKEMVDHLSDGSFDFNKEYSVEQHNLEHATQKLLSLLS